LERCPRWVGCRLVCSDLRSARCGCADAGGLSPTWLTSGWLWAALPCGAWLCMGPGTTIIHQGSYLTQILLIAGLALAASRYLPFAIVVAALQFWLLVSVYLLPFEPPLSSVVALLLGTTVIAAAAVVSVVASRAVRGTLVASRPRLSRVAPECSSSTKAAVKEVNTL
jgi:hypothetical protein